MPTDVLLMHPDGGARRFIAYTDLDSHFVAVRWLESQWEVNFSNKSHSWEKADVIHGPCGIDTYLAGKGGWIINAAGVDMLFEICDAASDCSIETGKNVGDVSGGSNHANPLPLSFSQEQPTGATILSRIHAVESLCAEYTAVLASHPGMRYRAPFPFVCEELWRQAFDSFRLGLLTDVGVELCLVDLVSVLRVAKRLRCFMSLLRQYSRNISVAPDTLRTMPNPCDPDMPKRSWEQAMYSRRQKAKGLVSHDPCVDATACETAVDALGGAENGNIHHYRQVARMLRDSKCKHRLRRCALEQEGVDLSVLGLKHLLPELLQTGFVQRCILPAPPTVA